MLDVNNLDELKNVTLYDVQNPCKYYKFVNEPILELQDIIDANNYNTITYKLSNYILYVKWNMWDLKFTLEIRQENGDIADYIEYGVGGDMSMIYMPRLPGLTYSFLFVFGVSVENRPLKIYLCFDILEEF